MTSPQHQATSPRRRRWVALTAASALCVVPLVHPVEAGAAVGAGGSPAPVSAGAAVPADGARSPGWKDPAHLPQWWYDALHLADAHQVTTGKGVVVAVIDSDLDPDVPDLKGADLSVRPGCERGTAKAYHGESASHGTAMVTQIVGQGSGNGQGGLGILGVAPEATVRHYNIATSHDSEPVSCTDINAAQVMLRAARQGADIISLSQGGWLENSPSTRRVIDEIGALGTVVVASAGNQPDDDEISSPSAYPGVVSVLAVDRGGKAWKDNAPVIASNDRWPTISAPGVDTPIGSKDTAGAWISGYPRSGTSQAAALVSGLLALVKARYPEATGNQLIQQLIHHPGDGKYEYVDDFGFGIASATQMLRTDPSGWPDVNPLLKGPDAALRDFPMSSYGKPAGASSTPSAGTGSAASPSSSSPRRSPADSPDSSSGGVPAWVWVLAVLVVLLLAAAAVALTRRRAAGRPGSADTTTDVHHTTRTRAQGD